MDANFINAIATFGNFVVAIAIAYFAYRSNKLNTTIHQENKDHSEQTNRLYWGLIISGILNIDDPLMRKRKLNILFTLFDAEEVVTKSKIPAKAFRKILAGIDGDQAENSLDKYEDKDN